jgi:anaerobic ribonucleoside-triphosphate reductase activating protein
MTVEELAKEFKDSTNHVTISGGEPFINVQGLFNIILELQADHPEKRFWIYTGFRYEELEELNPRLLKVLSELGVEVIVDGRFEEDKKDLTLQFRGSSNQRIIDLPKTIANGKITLWEETNGES